MYICESRFLTRGEVWFDEEPGDTRSVDWIIYYQRSHPVRGARCRDYYSYVIDLTQPVEQLLANLNSDTGHKIRRARERDKILCDCCDSTDPRVLDRFEEMYNEFAAVKGLGPLNRVQMDSMAAVGALDLSVAKDPQGNALVYHANYRDQSRARSLHLPSLYRKLSESATRNLISRANRYLTWSDILRYKEQGLKCFDFGGWYPGTTDQARLNINEFKKGFGGQIVREYECEQILTPKGWVVLHVAKLLAKLFPFSPNKPTVSVPPAPVQDPAMVPSA